MATRTDCCHGARNLSAVESLATSLLQGPYSFPRTARGSRLFTNYSFGLMGLGKGNVHSSKGEAVGSTKPRSCFRILNFLCARLRGRTVSLTYPG